MRRGHFANNLIANVANFAFTTAFAIWLIPYLVRHLGVAAYGLYPLANGITSYLALFTMAITSAVGRSMTMALDQGESDEANRIFNTSFWSTAGILLVLLVPTVWLSFHASSFFNVPPGADGDFSWLMLAVAGAFFVSTLSFPFGISAFAHNRFDILSALNIVNTVARVLVIVALFNLFRPHVWHVGSGVLFGTTCASLCTVIVWRKLTPNLEISWSWVSLHALKNMTKMGGWLVVNNLGALLFVSIDLIVVNRVVGITATGEYGAVMTWSVFFRAFAGVLAGVFAPSIFILFSRNDVSGLVHCSRRAVKFVGLVMALPIGLVCGLSRPLLQLWLGDPFVVFAPLLSLMTFHLCVNLAITPLFNVEVAVNRVRVPGIVTCVIGAMNVGLAALLAGPIGWGVYGVAAAGAILLTGKNLLFTPIYAAHILGLEWSAFYGEIVPVAGTTTAIAGLGWACTRWLPIDSWPFLVLIGVMFSVGALSFIYGVLLDDTERAYALRTFWPRGSQPA